MSVTANHRGLKSPGPLVASSWLDWSRDDDEYVGGDYRIRLIEPYRWEVLFRGDHLRFDDRLSAALAHAEHHYIEAVRIRDMTKWGLVTLVSAVGLALLVSTEGLTGFFTFPLSLVIIVTGLAALARFVAVATRNLYDPYRRRAPWEPRRWWERA